MSRRADLRSARFGPLCGLLYPACLILGDDVVAPVAGEAPGRGTPAAEVWAWANVSDTDRFYAGRFLGLLSIILLVVFVGSVVRRIRSLDDGWYADAAQGAGILVAGLQLSAAVPQLTAVRWAGTVDPTTVALVNDLSGTFGLSLLPLAAFLGIVSLVAVRGVLMARTVGWIGLLLATGAVVGCYAQTTTNHAEVGWTFAPLALTWMVWCPAAAVSLLRRAGVSGRDPGSEPSRGSSATAGASVR